MDKNTTWFTDGVYSVGAAAARAGGAALSDAPAPAALSGAASPAPAAAASALCTGVPQRRWGGAPMDAE